MTRLAAVFETPDQASVISRQLAGVFETIFIPFSEICAAEPPGQFTIVGVDLAIRCASAN
jgi:hypothetical protein